MEALAQALTAILVLCILIGFAVCASAALGSWGTHLVIRHRRGRWS